MKNQSPREYELFVKAIVKGAGEDMKSYCSSNPNETNNAFYLNRSDIINSNLRDIANNSNGRYELKHFPVNNWKGTLFIDRVNKESFSFFNKGSLDRIISNRDQNKQHFLKVILQVQNCKVKSSCNVTIQSPNF